VSVLKIINLNFLNVLVPTKTEKVKDMGTVNRHWEQSKKHNLIKAKEIYTIGGRSNASNLYASFPIVRILKNNYRSNTVMSYCN